LTNHDKYRENELKARNGGNYREWDGGKGDIDRSTHLTTYQLGVELMEIAEKHGHDSKQYKSKLAEWRAACAAAARRG
jgi:hypothetical protein